MDIKTTEELHAMSFEQLTDYRQQLDAHRSLLRDHCKEVGDRFRNLNDAINTAARLGCDDTLLRVTPGVAVGKAIGQAVRAKINPTLAKGGPLMAEALMAEAPRETEAAE